jgi:hypothetical protein
MGLLRRAAGTAGGGIGSVDAAAAPAETRRPKGPGLLGRSIRARQSEKKITPPPAADDLVQAVPLPDETGTPLSIELAEERAEQETAEGPLQFRVDTPGRGEEPVVQQAPAEPEPPVPSSVASQSGKSFEEIVGEVLAAISSLPPGVELPSRLFTVLTTLLGVRKGAFLLYDPARMVYAPWAVRGFDKTTLRRMRIPLGANDAWNALANGLPLVLVEASVLSSFQQYFSAREFASVGKLILVPFIAEGTLLAVFLLTEIDSPFATDDELSSCLSQAAQAGAPRVHEARAAQISSSGPAGARPDPVTLRDEPAAFLASLGTGKATVLLLSLSLEDFARSVLLAHEHLDPFRLHEDLGYFLGSFLADVGKALSVRQGRFTVALHDFDPAALDLFAHQLSLFLRGLFGGNGGREDRPPPRILKTCSWPADGSDLRSLVDSLAT